MSMMIHRNRVKAREMEKSVSPVTPVAEEKKVEKAEEPKKTVKRGRKKQ